MWFLFVDTIQTRGTDADTVPGTAAHPAEVGRGAGGEGEDGAALVLGELGGRDIHLLPQRRYS